VDESLIEGMSMIVGSHVIDNLVDVLHVSLTSCHDVFLMLTSRSLVVDAMDKRLLNMCHFLLMNLIIVLSFATSEKARLHIKEQWNTDNNCNQKVDGNLKKLFLV